jgi:periplasmic protein TonB
MIVRPWLGLVLSAALHAGAVALVLVAVSRDEPLPALLIDLRDPLAPGSASVGSAPPARQSPDAGSPARPSRRASAVLPTPPSEPMAPAPGAPAPPVEPPAPVVESPPTRTEAPRDSVPSDVVASTPSVTSAPTVAPPREPVEAWPSVGASSVTAGSPAPSAGVASAGGSAGGGITASTNPGTAGTVSAGAAGGPAGSPVASVPSSGIGAGSAAVVYGPYLAALRQRIQESLRYPASARRRGLAGTVSVEILILANGTIGEVALLESSTHAVLDDAALETIRALPRMPLPRELPARPLRVRVPVVFQMR